MPLVVEKAKANLIIAETFARLVMKGAKPRDDSSLFLSEADRERLEADWEVWLQTLFRKYISRRDTGELIPFAKRHIELWDWVWSIRLGIRPRPFIAIWPRGGAKSTSAELATVALAARGVRRYALYVSETQDQADDHVQNIGSMLESRELEKVHPLLASRMISKYGHSKGWRRNRLRTAAGFTVDALGLDVASRGIKLEEQRPDLIVIDDVDGESDSEAITEKKIKALTKKILPAGARDVAVLFVQNLIIPDGIASRLAGVSYKRIDFLQDRIVSGPYPAIDGLAVEQQVEDDGSLRFVITAGEPTWEGQDLEACQNLMDDIGYSAFLEECQHEVTVPPGGMFDHLVYQHVKHTEVPDLVHVAVSVDPAVSDTDSSDSHGIQVDGLGVDNLIYRLFSWEQRATPKEALGKALHKCGEYKSDILIVETDQGGDLWRDEIDTVWRDLKAELRRLYDMTRLPRLKFRKAGSIGPKTHRAQKMLVDYERGIFRHVIGTHHILEASLNRFPKTKPYDLVDAAYWSWHELAQSNIIGAAPIGIPRASPVMRRF